LRVPWGRAETGAAADRHAGKTIGPKQAKKIMETVLKASKSAEKGTHIRALMNPLNPGYDPKYKTAWNILTEVDRKEVLRKQEQQIATRQSKISQVKLEKKDEQLSKRAEKKFKAIDVDESGDISIEELRASMLGQQAFGSFSPRGVSEADVARRFEDMDVNRDGKISLTEFRDGLKRESAKREEDFWGSFHEKSATVLDLKKKATAAQASPAKAAPFETGPDVVGDMSRKLSEMSAAASSRLSSGASSPGDGRAASTDSDLSSFRKESLEALRKSMGSK